MFYVPVGRILGQYKCEVNITMSQYMCEVTVLRHPPSTSVLQQNESNLKKYYLDLNMSNREKGVRILTLQGKI